MAVSDTWAERSCDPIDAIGAFGCAARYSLCPAAHLQPIKLHGNSESENSSGFDARQHIRHDTSLPQFKAIAILGHHISNAPSPRRLLPEACLR